VQVRRNEDTRIHHNAAHRGHDGTDTPTGHRTQQQVWFQEFRQQSSKRESTTRKGRAGQGTERQSGQSIRSGLGKLQQEQKRGRRGCGHSDQTERHEGRAQRWRVHERQEAETGMGRIQRELRGWQEEGKEQTRTCEEVGSQLQRICHSTA